MDNKTINLSDKLIYGKGFHKKCYIHPYNPNLCIKIAYNEERKEDIEREINYLTILLKRNKDYKILPKYYGKISTNIGEGYVFELICNYDNTPCQTLENFLSNQKLLQENYDMILTSLKSLKNELLKNEIITLDLFAHNILLQKIAPDRYQVRIVNDMGSAVLIPLEYYFHYFAKTKIKRHWNRFITSLNKKYPSILIKKIIEEIK